LGSTAGKKEPEGEIQKFGGAGCGEVIVVGEGKIGAACKKRLITSMFSRSGRKVWSESDEKPQSGKGKGREIEPQRINKGEAGNGTSAGVLNAF